MILLLYKQKILHNILYLYVSRKLIKYEIILFGTLHLNKKKLKNSNMKSMYNIKIICILHFNKKTYF